MYVLAPSGVGRHRTIKDNSPHNTLLRSLVRYRTRAKSRLTEFRQVQKHGYISLGIKYETETREERLDMLQRRARVEEKGLFEQGFGG